MHRGSIVRCNTDFPEERKEWRHPYPYAGDLLVISGLNRHYPSGKLLLTFEETRTTLTIPLSEDCFDEVQTPEEGNAILQKIRQILMK
jgi:hypothetical protein